MKDVSTLLSNRLLEVCNQVKICDVIYDIGTDHCYVPIYLIQNKICKKAVATDIKQGPVDRALANVDIYALHEEIECFVSDGIEHVPMNADIVISGMGADVIISVLTKHFEIAKSAKQIVIQCQSKPALLRSFLWDNGFSIYKEGLTKEKNRVYNVLCAVYKGTPVDASIYTTVEAELSKLLKDERHPLYLDYARAYERRLKRGLSSMREHFLNEEQKNQNTQQRYEQLTKELEELHETIRSFKIS